MISSEQIRAARAILRLEQRDLAQRTGISTATVRRLEARDGNKDVAPATLARVRGALEQAGIEFMPDDGVCRRRARRTDEEKEQLRRDLQAIVDSAAALPPDNPDFGEDDLYDENGLPA